MAKLCIFNPDHELALASDDRNFQPNKNVQKLVDDLELLPVWRVSDCYVEKSKINDEWENFAQQLNLKYNAVSVIPYFKVKDFEVWGWNRTIYKKLVKAGLNADLMPSETDLERIRTLTSRETAIYCLKFLTKNLKQYPFPNLPVIVDTRVEMKKLPKPVILKQLYSSSGQGVIVMSENQKSKPVKKIFREKQKVIAEKYYNVVQNFALEFRINDEQKTEFIGYSLFENDRGMQYKYNYLFRDSVIEKILSIYIDVSMLYAVKQLLIEFFDENIAPDYQGCLGVDMFVYEINKKFLLHPCVEINLRSTMGFEAHEFYKNFVNPKKSGIFAIDFFPDKYQLSIDDIKRKINNSLEIYEGKIQKGYISLTPVFDDTQFRARVEVY
jgi:hypothetical protein